MVRANQLISIESNDTKDDLDWMSGHQCGGKRILLLHFSHWKHLFIDYPLPL